MIFYGQNKYLATAVTPILRVFFTSETYSNALAKGKLGTILSIFDDWSFVDFLPVFDFGIDKADHFQVHVEIVATWLKVSCFDIIFVNFVLR